MEFEVRLAGAGAALPAIQALLWQKDPAALVDCDAGGSRLRVKAWISAAQLTEILVQAGFPPSEVSQLPSVCCGDCSG